MTSLSVFWLGLCSSFGYAGELETKAKAVLVGAIGQIQSKDFDGWIKEFCDPEACSTPYAKAQWKAYQLKQLSLQGKYCLHDGAIVVSRWKGDLQKGRAKAYIRCSNRQFDPPIEFRYDRENDKIWIRNTSI